MSAVPNPIVVPMSVATNTLSVALAVASNTYNVGMGVDFVVVSGLSEHYVGEYEFTPTDTAQTVSIKDKVADEDIIINPIPSNYGKISWNGSVLTVS